MFTTLLISFREFLEVFLIIGVFLGISRKLHLKREKEILFASSIGIGLSLFLSIIVFSLGNTAKFVFTEKNADVLEGYLMTFSGFFIAYVIFSLHKFFVLKRSKAIITAHQKLQSNIFDFSLFLTIIFFVLREGFEIALFTATTSLFAKFMENLAGLILGFGLSAVIGMAAFFTYNRLPIGKVFKYTEFMIVFLGANFIKNGITELCEFYWHIQLGNILPFHLDFLPDHDTFIGHFLLNTFGLEQNFSLVKLGLMMLYLFAIYNLFLMRIKKQIN